MSEPIIHSDTRSVHSDEIQDIIEKVPSWILRWGLLMIFLFLSLIVGLSFFIRYPDMLNARLIIESPNSPKPIISKLSGKLQKLLVIEHQTVFKGQPLAYIESTANHAKVLALLNNLKKMQQQFMDDIPINGLLLTQNGDDMQLGELQSNYQLFYEQYLTYVSSISNGYLVKKRRFSQQDLDYNLRQQQQLILQKTILQKDDTLAMQDFNMHKKLLDSKVETKAEYRQQQSKLFSKQLPIVQIESAIIDADNNYRLKQKEILEIDDEIRQGKNKFLQALNSLISEIEDWKSKYILTASENGILEFAGIVQENQMLMPNQEIFYINPGNEQFYGMMEISQNSVGKVKTGQKVLIKLRSYPFEEYGIIRGQISHIDDVPYRDSIYISHVILSKTKLSSSEKNIHLKNGMVADAEIITQDATIFQRIKRNVFKLSHQ